mgnify:CR=1 FL=1
MPLYNKILEKELRKNFNRELGTADPLNIRGGLQILGEKYQELPEDVRENVQEAGSMLGTAWEGAKRIDNKYDPFEYAASGAAHTIEGIGKVYSAVVDPVKKELSKATGLDPINFDAAEIAADVLTPGIPLAKKSYAKILNIIDSSPFKVPNPFKAAQMAANVGTGFDYHPRPGWLDNLTPEQIAVERQLRLDQFTDATLLPDGTIDTTNPLVYKSEVKVSPRGVPISKRKEAGYKFLGDFASEWNTWSNDARFIDELADAPRTAFVEHLVGKGDRLNWFWDIPDELRFRKGSRHGPDNVRIFYSDRQKKLKDATENILYKMQENMNPMDRLIVEYDIPRMEGKSITVRQPAGDVILRKVDGTIVGRIGDFHDVLYAPTEDLIRGLTTNINPRTGTFYIDPNTTDMKRAIRHWREDIIRNKLNSIMDEAPNIEGKSASAVYQEQVGKIIDEEMAAFREEFDFIPKPRGSTLDADMAATSFEGPPPDLPLLNKLLGKDPNPELKSFVIDNPDGLNMLVDSLNGMNWRQLRSKYKQRYKRSKLEKAKDQLTSAQVQRIKQAYGEGGKGGLGKTTFQPPFKGYTKTLEQKTTRYKGTGRVDAEDAENIINEVWDDK